MATGGIARRLARVAWAGVVSAGCAVVPMTSGAAEPDAHPLAARLCTVLRDRVDAVPGGGPLLLPSWEGASGSGPPDEPALSGAAFTYDNALAVVALLSCGHRSQAGRIGEALRLAASEDRSGQSGRVRNAYRAGAQRERPLPPMGWWDAPTGRWVEDAYQVGTATGNVAWAALALLALAETDGQAIGKARNGTAAGAGTTARAESWREAAARLADWAVAHARDDRPPYGFTGGLHGFDDAPRRLGWKSAEHQVDLIAVFDRLARPAHAAHARALLDALWDDTAGRFRVGTLPDGATLNPGRSALDAQLWPSMLPQAPQRWRRALAFVERAQAVGGGFDFDDDRDGVWVEGTAQAALAMRLAGRRADAWRLLDGLAADQSPGGHLWATRTASISTGLAIGPGSTTDDFRYYRRPHLGATAWALLAATGRNPFAAAPRATTAVPSGQR